MQMLHALLRSRSLIIFLINQVSALTTNEFFSFGVFNEDAALPDGDDVAVSEDFIAPFFFFGKTYTSFGVSITNYFIL